MTKVVVIILNWNRKDDTIECLRSIDNLKTDSCQLKVVVVDNGSIDGSVEALKKEASNKNKNYSLKLILNKENLGFAAGNNIGIKYALNDGADFVMVLNNDTYVSSELVVNFLDGANKYKDAGIFSPKIYFAPGFEYRKERYKQGDKGRVLWYAGGILDWKNVFGINRGVDEVDSGQYDKETDLDFATGACMFIRRQVLEEVGLFDERYFLYLEDVDFSWRVRRAGWRIVYLPTAYLWHKVSQSSGIGSSLADYYISRNRLLFGMTYAPTRTKLALLKESAKLILFGRHWQKVGVIDFYRGRFGYGRYDFGVKEKL